MRHIRTMTSMYDSRRERVTLLCDNAMMNAVVDAFGENVETKAFGDDAFTVETETAASPVFYRWVFGYGGKIRITEPENVKKEYAEMVKSAAEGLLLCNRLKIFTLWLAFGALFWRNVNEEHAGFMYPQVKSSRVRFSAVY